MILIYTNNIECVSVFPLSVVWFRCHRPIIVEMTKEHNRSLVISNSIYFVFTPL